MAGLEPLKPLTAFKPLEPIGGKANLDTSNGLYSLAYKSGLQKQADDIVKLNSGEEHKKFFAGGFISDVFDVLNVASYGVVGALKGKGFNEGIKNRESFSDQDALGRYGVSGVIGGIILDIATDPFTYVAPWKILAKVPGLAKAGKMGKEFTFGKNVTKTIDDTGETYQTIEGGIKLPFAEKTGIENMGQVAQKFAWMFGQDPVFKNLYEANMRNKGIQISKSAEMIKHFSTLDPIIMAKTIVRDETGRFARKSGDDLMRDLSKEDFAKVAPIWDKIDSLGQELVDLGVLGKGKFEENFGTYLKNAYREYEIAKDGGKKFFDAKTLGVKGTKARKEGLTPEMMQKLGQIDNPDYLLGKSMLDMIKDVEDARLFKDVGKFASSKPQVGFTQLPDARRLRTSIGKVAELARKVRETNDALKPFLKGLKGTFKADKNLSREADNLAKELESLGIKRADELTRYFSEGAVTTKTTKTSRRIGTIFDKLTPIATKIKQYENYDDMYRSADGIELEKLDLDGVLQREGFPTMEKFFDYVKNPFKEAVEKVSDDVMEGDIQKIIALQKKIEQMASKSVLLTDIEKRSINDSFRHLERNISDLRLKKSDLMEEIDINKMGDLAGKYLPTDMAGYIDEIVKTKSPFGAKLISEFKYMKVVFNPSTHVRNILSNKVLNWWKLGVGPWRTDLDYQALRSIATKDKWYQRAQDVGMGANTYAANELKGILEDPAMLGMIDKYGGKWDKVKHFFGDLYQKEENWAKMVAFRDAVERKGISDIDAWKVAESATFNYAQVTPFIRQLRTAIWGVPFITFPLKAIPVVVETAFKNPHRIAFFGKFRNSIENLTNQKETEEEKKSLPPYMRDGFFFKLPMKDKDGRSMYFDLTYIIPFGDLLSGQLFERPISRETGLKEGIPSSILSKNPVANLIKELANNQDFYGNRIVKETDPMETQVMDLSNHVAKTFLPPWVSDQMPAGYNDKGERSISPGIVRAATEGGVGQKRNLLEDIFKYAGFKVQPVDEEVQSSINEFNKKKGLQRLLQDNGLVSDFSKVYQPK